MGNNRRQTLMGKYYSVCCAIILASLVFLGAILSVLTNNYFKEDKYRLLSQNVSQAVSVTLSNYESHNYRYVSSDVLQPIFAVLGNAIDSNIILIDNEGRILVSASEMDAKYIPEATTKEIMESLQTYGEYQAVSDLGTMYDEMQYVISQPIVNSEDQLVGAVLAALPTLVQRSLMGDIFKIFLISSMIAMVVSFIAIYFVTDSLVKPLRQMSQATKAFAMGDFSIRVPVVGDDEIARLATSFNSMATSLALAETTRRSFTANVSHELRTPMTSIGGFIDGILDGTIPPEKEKHYLEIVSAEVKRLGRLVRNMLTLSQIEAGEKEITPQPLELTGIISETLLGFEKRLEEKQLEIEGLDVERQWVLGDADLISQVIYNLIDNAVKFVNDKGTLSFRFEAEGPNIMTTIRNTGEGVLPEEIPKIFDRFYKSDKSRSMDKNGVGLGLSICRTVMNIHDGIIFVHSEPDQYTEFTFGLKHDPSHKKNYNRKEPLVDAKYTEVTQ